MDVKVILEKITRYIQKFKYPIIVLLVGIVLMLLPGPAAKSKNNDSIKIPEETEPACSVEEQLKQVLSQIDGAGQVEVMLSIENGEEMFYQYNENISDSETANSIQKTIVTVSDTERNQTGLIRQIKPATYKGAIIVCEGADNSAIHLAIVDAVSKITGLGANRISVLKMK